MPGFDEAPEFDNVDHDYAAPIPEQNPNRLRRVIRNAREDASIVTAGRAFLPVGTQTPYS